MITTRKCVLFASAIVSSVAFGGAENTPPKPTYPFDEENTGWKDVGCKDTKNVQQSPISFPTTPDVAVMSTDQLSFNFESTAYTDFTAVRVDAPNVENISGEDEKKNVWSVTLTPILNSKQLGAVGHTVEYENVEYKFDHVRLHAQAEHQFKSEGSVRAAEIEIEYVQNVEIDADADHTKAAKKLYVSVTVAKGAKGKTNNFIQAMLSALPGAGKNVGVAGDIKSILEDKTLENAQVYDGTSTIPDCEAAKWLVFTEPIVISNDQATAITEFFNIGVAGYIGNVRPVNDVGANAHIMQQTFSGAGNCTIAAHQFGTYQYPDNESSDWGVETCKPKTQQSPVKFKAPAKEAKTTKVEFNGNFDGAVNNKWVVGFRKKSAVAISQANPVVEAYLEAINLNKENMKLTIEETDHYFKGVYLHGVAEHQFHDEAKARAAEAQFVFEAKEDKDGKTSAKSSILSVTFKDGGKEAKKNAWLDNMLKQISDMDKEAKNSTEKYSRILKKKETFNGLNISNVLVNSALNDATLMSYNGTFTTPKCAAATWYVFNDAIEISADQVKDIAALFHPEAPTTRRTLAEVTSFRGTPTTQVAAASQDRVLSEESVSTTEGNARKIYDIKDLEKVETLKYSYKAKPKDNSASTTKAASSAAIIAIMATVALMM